MSWAQLPSPAAYTQGSGWGHPGGLHPFPTRDETEAVLEFPMVWGETGVTGSCMAPIGDYGQRGVLLTFSAWGPGGPGAPALPGNPGGPYINKGVGGSESGAEGGAPLPSSFCVCVTVVDAF